MATLTLKLSPEHDGYLLDGAFHAGFMDRPELPTPLRHRIARWGRQLAPQDLSAEQRALLDTAASVPPSDHRRRAEHRSAMLASPLIRPLWDTLSADERALVLNPDERLGDGARYPLTSGQLAELVDMEQHTVRRWGDAQLLPATRNERNHREYGAAAAIMAFALRGSKQNDREYYGDLAESPEPVTALRRSYALATYSALTSPGKGDAEELRQELSILVAEMRALADALVEAVEAVDEPTPGAAFARLTDAREYY